MSEEWIPWKKRPGNRERYLELKRAYRERARAHNKPKPRPKRCEVCGREGDTVNDHCHTTGKFRGFICMWCNSALGFAKDNPNILRKLAEYLEQRIKS